MTTKFKVGDKVKILSKREEWSGPIEFMDKNSYKTIGLIGFSNGYEQVFGNSNLQIDYWGIFKDDELELVEEEPKKNECEPCSGTNGDMLYIEPNHTYIFQTKDFNYKPKQTIMSKITTFAKNLVLSADEKLLRKYGLHDECGKNTSEAEDVIDEKNYNSPENQAYLLELAKGLEAEESKK